MGTDRDRKDLFGSQVARRSRTIKRRENLLEADLGDEGVDVAVRQLTVVVECRDAMKLPAVDGDRRARLPY
jgi:hypothetical protein